MHVGYITLDDAREAAFAEQPAAALPPVYRHRVERMQSAAARARTAAGLWLLEQALAALNMPPEMLDGLGFSAHGKPELVHGPYFSIAHSARLVACAVSAEHAVGLDVEIRRDDVSPRLRQAIAAEHDFFDAWCAREATVKAGGRVGLARIRRIELDGRVARLDGRDWHLCGLSLVPGYSACVASDRPLSARDVCCVDCSSRFSPARGE